MPEDNIPTVGSLVPVVVAGVTPPLPPQEPAPTPTNDAPPVIQYRVKELIPSREEVEEPVAINERNDDPNVTYDDGKERNIAIVKEKI